ncbi:MAG: EAL domain-containing protein [Clostridiales bacterium]|nr:EAL domain-containing protein [Clostridiales bacterium]
MHKRCILAVDDELENLQMLQDILKDEYVILKAANGKEALTILSNNADGISAVILDIEMPVMDGYEVLSTMRKTKKLSVIPVIVSSRGECDKAEIRSLSLGAQDFVVKPYKADILRHRLGNLIKLRETAAIFNKTERDEVTGLYNKQFFMQKLSELLNNGESEQYDLICIGVEQFKLINDTYGVCGGDKVLHHIGRILQAACSRYNICGRFEADKFYGILPHSEIYTNEMFLPWKKKVNCFPIDMDIKVHCGIYYIHNKTVPIEAMCDRALLAADKNRGKYDELFYIYDDSIRKKLLEEQFITSNMQTAIDQNQFQVYYQPKYDLETEKVIGAEALVRWIHPEKGIIFPADFIPIFEKNGFITKLDEYVWETACKDLRTWMDAGIPVVAISVNVSRADLYNPKMIGNLLQIINKYGIPLSYIHLEITESAYTENPKQIVSVVRKLRDLGFLIEMDDFGSGYSSLNMLADMPVDVLKLDMGFIRSETQVLSSKGILGFVISLAKWLNLSVVAEGVETKEQIVALRSMQCNYAQGYYYAKPMNYESFSKVLKTLLIRERKNLVEIHANPKMEIQPDPVSVKEKVILIVDDIEINRVILTSSFAGKYQVEKKENGQEAWEYLENNYDKVVGILLDLFMPIMDGYQLLEKIRSDWRTKNIPVIITSSGDTNCELKALEMGADDFISKPYMPYIIQQRMENVLARYELKQLKQKNAH